MAVRGLIAIFALFLALEASAGPARRVIAVDVDGMVHPITTEIISAALEEAGRSHADLVILRLNTPGGLMEAMRQSIEKIAASPVPVATLVAPSGGRAASAGFFLLEAGDVAAMCPGTNTGAAHPVLMAGEMDAVMKQKVENDAAAYLRSLSAKRGRNSAMAEKAVLESRSFTEREALDNHLIDLIARDERDLLAQLDGREITRFDGSHQTLHTAGAEIAVYKRSWRQSLISAIADPNLALILLVLGALAIYVEFTHPGAVVFGAAGAIMVLLGLSAISVLPVNWMGAALLVVAVALFVLEAKLGTHGVLGVAGAVAMMLGAVTLVDTPAQEMRIHWSTAVSLALPFSLITVLLLRLAIRARRNKIETGPEGMIGLTGVALTALAPRGRVQMHGEYWSAIAAVPLAEGTPVRVLGIEGLELRVEAVTPPKGA